MRTLIGFISKRSVTKMNDNIWLEVRRYGLFGECECDLILHVGEKEYDEDVLDRLFKDDVIRQRILELLEG